MKFFSNIHHIGFEGERSTNPFAFKYYHKDRIVLGKTMGEHLPFAMSYWHTLAADNQDMFGRGTADKSFGGKSPMEIYENKVYAGFEFMEKLGIRYFCFHDRDIAPEGNSLAETNANLDHIVAIIKKEMQRTGIKLLWGTANLFSHPRYMHGAGTSPNADVFAFAAAQLKKAIEITHQLNGQGYTFWGGREGYETLLNTNLKFEQDNLARLLRMAIDYGRSIGFEGNFYIEPKPKEPTKHQYDFDAATTFAFLQKYDLLKDVKLNLEANHATLAGHSFQHEIRVARENGVLGSLDINRGDTLLGWDTDNFPTDIYDNSLMMYEVLKNGGLGLGGLNFDAKTRRGSFTHDDLFLAYIAGMDAVAFGLLVAEQMIADGRLDKFVEDRYSSYKNGIGAKIIKDATTIQELESYALQLGEVKTNISGKQELLESILNQMIINTK